VARIDATRAARLACALFRACLLVLIAGSLRFGRLPLTWCGAARFALAGRCPVLA
jgi:hypothetical protein